MNALRILVVGVCTAGKSTLVQSLRQLGWQAYSVAQEHSSVPGLWRLRKPDFVIYLDVSYEAACRRRRVYWPASRLWAQRQRLAQARAHCQLALDTTDMTSEQVLSCVVAALWERGDRVGFADVGNIEGHAGS